MKISVTLIVITIGFALACGCRSGDTENAEDKRVPVTLDTALKLGSWQLTKVVDVGESEAGQDLAARLYATAKRIETEHALARRDLELVLQLDVWREALADCRVGSCDLARIYFGGGTMYGHGATRDGAPLEDFLADLAKRLPLAEGKGSAKAARQIDGAIAFIKSLNLVHGQDLEPEEWAKTRFPAEVARVTEHWDHLKELIKDVPEAEANQISAFAVESLNWLKEMQ
jgi:hypothetical protein